MAMKIESFFFTSGLLLLTTATAKLISSGGTALSLQMGDPIFHLSFREMFIAMGIMESVIGLICFLAKSVRLRAGLLAWLSSAFVVYRIGLNWMGWHKPCSCLGNLTDVLHISSEAADIASKIILAYLIIGSYAILFWLFWMPKSTSSPVK